MILAGDIGGTKTLLALYRNDGRILQQEIRKTYPSQDFDSFSNVLQQFIASSRPDTITAMALGIAGPIIDQACCTTNLPWTIVTRDLQLALKLDAVFLLNDLEATAYGMLHLPESDFLTLNSGEPKPGNIAVIAAGTGLGEAILHRAGNQWHPIATEGGHCEFAPQNKRQDDLLQWLRTLYPDHVSLERILSGDGIINLYRFLLESDAASPPAEFSALASSTFPTAQQISDQAINHHNPLCKATLQLFTEIYGAEAGNLALKSLPRSGLFIGGGIGPKIQPLLTNGTFIKSFSNKGRFSQMMKEIPVKLSLNEETALIGAAYYAHHRQH